MTTLRNLPSVEQILQTEVAAQLIVGFGRPLTLDAIRFVLDGTRARFKSGGMPVLPSTDLILAQTESNFNRVDTADSDPGHQCFGRDPAYQSGARPPEQVCHPCHGPGFTRLFHPRI